MNDEEKAAKRLPESGTVTVACNLPNGLILELYEFEDEDQPVLGGGTKTVKVAHKKLTEKGDPLKVVLHGTAVPHGQRPRCVLVGNYALTSGVDAQFFAEWMRQNKNAAYVKNRCVFAHSTSASAKDAAKELKGNLSGLDPLNVPLDGTGKIEDPRVPKRMGVTTAEDFRAPSQVN